MNKISRLVKGEKQREDLIQSTENHQKKMYFKLLYIIIWMIWLVSIYISRSSFLNARNDNPLAMIDSLSPLFYLTIFLFISLCIYYIWSSIENKIFDLLLLIQLGFLLWFTPNYLSGFVYDPAGIYHSGVAYHIPAVMNGEPFVISSYGNNYPGSFIVSYAILKVIGVDIPTYVNLIFPILYIPAFTLFWYLIVSRLFNSNIAFYSMLIAFPGLHYFKIYPSPQTMGTILVFTSVLLFIIGINFRTKMVGLMAFGCIFFTHPISPVIAIIFILVLYIVKIPLQRLKLSLKHLLIIGGGIATFIILVYVSPLRAAVELTFNRLQRLFSPTAISSLFDILFKPHFLYGEIYLLNQLVYIVYFLMALIPIALIIRVGFKSTKGVKNGISSSLKLIGRKRLYLLITAFLLILFGVILYIITSLQDLIERTLTFFILVITVFIVSILIDYAPKLKNRHFSNNNKDSFVAMKSNTKNIFVLFIGIWLILMAITFPIVAYSIGVYNATPPSEDIGLMFLSENIPLNDKNISISFLSQMAMYLKPPINVSLPPGPLYDTENIQNLTDIAVFRSIGYYYFSMRVDLSLNDNRWNLYKEEIDNSFIFNKIYSNPTFEIYLRDRNE